MRAIIIDDEPLAHQVILKYSELMPQLKIVAQCFDAEDGFSKCNSEKPDLLFLDIQMPQITGLEFLRGLPEMPAVIITSAYNEYALEGFELNVTDYLLKPYSFERFAKAVNRVKASDTNSDNLQLFIKVDKQLVQVQASEIYFLESFGNYVKVWLADHYLLTPKTMKAFEEELNKGFIRVHKSFLIQQKLIQSIEGNMVHMKNGKSILVSKNRRSMLKEILGI